MKRSPKKFKKLDKFQAKIVMNWVEKHLIDCKVPRMYVKRLTGNWS